MTHLPAVRHAALTHRGVNSRALHLHLRFERPLVASEQMAVLAEVGFLHAHKNGPALLPEFPQADIVLLSPAINQALAMNDYAAAARHFGYTPADGHLAFIMNDDQLGVIAEMPAMPQ